MTGRLLLKLALLGFVAVSLGHMLFKAAAVRAEALRAARKPAAAAAAAPGAARPAAQKTAVVYYFYTNTRCYTCRTIEEYTRAAVAGKLSGGYKGWKVEFRGVNLDEAANEHYARDYRLESKAVVVQAFAGDKPLKWARLDRVWTLTGDKTAFVNYVARETGTLLDGL